MKKPKTFTLSDKELKNIIKNVYQKGLIKNHVFLSMKEPEYVDMLFEHVDMLKTIKP